jgi:hypothetical protein
LKKHIYCLFLQKPNSDIIKALELCEVTVMNLQEMKINCFDEIIKDCTIICEQENIDIPNIESVCEASSNQEPKQSTKKRKINDNDDLSCNIKNHKEKFIKIIDIYIIEIRKRFNKEELNLIISLYSILMLKDSQESSIIK